MQISNDVLSQALVGLKLNPLNLLAAIINLAIFWLIAGLLSRLLNRYFVTRSKSPQVAGFVTSIGYYSVLAFGMIAALQTIGINMTALIAGLGIVGFAVGFALQDVSKNLIAGALLLLQEPFQINESIQVAGFEGTVQRVSLRAIEMKTFDGRLVMIPNADVYVSPITNYSRTDRRRIEILTSIPLDANLAEARKLLLETVAGLPGVLPDPKSQVLFQAFSDYAVNVTIWFWINPKETDLLTSRDAGLVAVKAALDAAGLEIPNPVQLLRMEPGERLPGQG
jgi:small-conductance mechanosensitive channel